MKKYKKIICMIAAVCLLGTAAFCGFRIYSHYAHESEQEEVFEKIAEVMEQAQTGESETADVLLTEEETVLAEYGELYLQKYGYGRLAFDCRHEYQLSRNADPEQPQLLSEAQF